MKIADHDLGPGHPVFLVAEVGVTAMGDVGRCRALIDAAGYAGCDAVKFILSSADHLIGNPRDLYTYDSYACGRITRPLYDLVKETELAPADWMKVARHAAEQNITFFVTVDYLDGVALALDLGVPALKLSAWDIAYLPLVDRVAATKLPVLVDVGTATREEVRAVNDRLGDRMLFVHDPHPPAWNLSRCRGFFRPDYPWGFSSPGREAWCDFVALGGGACVLEKRLTLRRNEPRGHHHAISLEPDEFRRWVQDIRTAETAMQDDPFGGSLEAWAERKKYDRDERGLRP